MYFRILHNGVSGELTYLLADQDTREAVLIDPHACDLTLLSALLAERDLRLRWVLRTHQHDVGESEQLARLQAPLVQGDTLSNVQLIDRNCLLFGDELIRVLPTPGHTADCLSFGWRDRVFCGGLLAVTGCPHQSHPTSAEALWDSVTRTILALPDETLLFVGHEHRSPVVTTVLEQRRWHPYFAQLTRDEFLARMSALAENKLPVSTH